MELIVYRSKSYVDAQRISTGKNVLTTVRAVIEPAALAEHTRRTMIEWWHEYPGEIRGLSSSSDWSEIEPTMNRRNEMALEHDGEPESVTPDVVDAWIAEYSARVSTGRAAAAAEAEREIQNRAAEQAQRDAEYAAQTPAIDAFMSDAQARPTKTDLYGYGQSITLGDITVREGHPRFAALRAEVESRRDRDYAEQRERDNAERAAWIGQHGSPRLKRLVAEGIEHDSVYEEERSQERIRQLAEARPGWDFTSYVDGEAKEVRNAQQEGLDLLDEARKTAPDAKLVWWVVEPPEHDEDEDTRSEGGWKGYACTAEFLGRDIVYGVPDEYAG